MRITIVLIWALLAAANVQAGDPSDGQQLDQQKMEKQLMEAQKALEAAAKRLAELHAKGYVDRGPKKAMLGILLGSEPMIGGVDLHGTTPKGGAVQAGLKAGDKIVVIDGIDLTTADDPLGVLSGHMKSVEPGEQVKVVYLRGKQRHDAVITTQARSAHIFSMIDNIGNDLNIDIDLEGLKSFDNVTRKVLTFDQPLMSVSGDLADYFGVDEGVVVTQPQADSTLKGGDVLLAINGQDVESLGSAMVQLAELDSPASVKVRRKGRTRTVEVNPHEFHGVKHQDVKIIKVIEKDD